MANAATVRARAAARAATATATARTIRSGPFRARVAATGMEALDESARALGLYDSAGRRADGGLVARPGGAERAATAVADGALVADAAWVGVATGAAHSGSDRELRCGESQ